MALIKILSEGDTLLFGDEPKPISVTVTAKAGRQTVLKIDTERSVRIVSVSKDRIWVGTPA